MGYSQNLEEEKILEYFGDYVGSFLDIGCNDCRTFSNTHALALRGWAGVVIDASPKAVVAIDDAVARMTPARATTTWTSHRQWQASTATSGHRRATRSSWTRVRSPSGGTGQSEAAQASPCHQAAQ